MLSSFVILSSCFAGFPIIIASIVHSQIGGTPQSDGAGGEFEFLNYGTCYIDPSDTRILAVPYSWVAGEASGYAQRSIVISDFQGVDQDRENSKNDAVPFSDSTITAGFDYTIPLTSIADGDVVTDVIPVTSPNASPTLIFTSGTTTDTETDTATPTTTVTEVTETRTIYAKANTVTKTHTITPPPYTHTDFKIEIATTTPSCIDPKPNHKCRNAIRAVDVLVEEIHVATPLFAWIPALFKRGTDITNYGTPSCGPYNPIVVYTTTVVSNPMVYTTPSITVPATTTIITTIPGLATETSYRNIKATTTITPKAHTVTKIKFAEQQTVDVTTTIQIVETVCGKKTHLCPTFKPYS